MPITWRQIATICATIVVVVWTGVAFLAGIVQTRLDRIDERQIFTRELVIELQEQVGQLRAEIVAVKCRIDVDLCGPGN